MKRVGNHTWATTEPQPIEIGMPAVPPSDAALAAMRAALSATGATTVYWFWVSINGDAPHLGLAVAPPNQVVISSVGSAIEPVWRRHSPQNPAFDVLRFGDPELDLAIKRRARLLYRGSPPAAGGQ